MKAVVLAGGLGTRLRPLTYSRPKPMLPLGPKPVLQHVIEALARQGFDEIVVTTNYLEGQIEGYFGDGSRFGLTIRYPKEDRPLGTAGSVKNAEQFLDETFVVIQGDNITDIDMAKQLRYHKAKRAWATIGVMRVDEPWKYGVVELGDDNRIIGFQEKPAASECRGNLINTGLYVLEPKVLDLVPRRKSFDFARDVFPKILGAQQRLYGYRAEGFWTDVGSLDGFLEASDWILGKMQSIISPDADAGKATVSGRVWIGGQTTVERGVEIRGPAYIEGPCTIRKDALVGPGTVLKSRVNVGESSRLNGASVFGSTDIHSKVTLNRCIVDEKCDLGSGARVEASAIIGAGCRIGENAIIGAGVRIDPGSVVERGKMIRT